jgi:hypothetical protein
MISWPARRYHEMAEGQKSGGRRDRTGLRAAQDGRASDTARPWSSDILQYEFHPQAYATTLLLSPGSAPRDRTATNSAADHDRATIKAQKQIGASLNTSGMDVAVRQIERQVREVSQVCPFHYRFCTTLDGRQDTALSLAWTPYSAL